MVGGGAIGNIGPDTLTVPRPPENVSYAWLASVTNPLPGVGGRDPESREHARRYGPSTFQDPVVAVTAADYEVAARAYKDPDGSQPVQQAKADFRWTGSWLTVTLAVDPISRQELDPKLRAALLRYLDARRLAGYDLDLRRTAYLPVELAIELCVKPGFGAEGVRQAVRAALSNRDEAGGRRGLFHPDNFSFGDNLYVSRIYAAVMSVPGVESAQITRLARMSAAFPDQETASNLRQGYLPVGLDQIVRLDNDRNFRSNGTLLVTVKGVAA
jgi:predicted phage baseplate assembly protein